MFNNCYPCCGVLAVALRNWGPTLNCWNYSGWDYPARQQWAASGFTTLNGNPGLGQPGSVTTPGFVGAYSPETLFRVSASVMLAYGESSTRVRLGLTHFYPPGYPSTWVASSLAVEYEKSHANGAPRDRYEPGVWHFTAADVSSVDTPYSAGPMFPISAADVGDIAIIQKAPAWDFSQRTYAITLTCGSPLYRYPPDTCGNRDYRSMAGVNGHTFELTLTDEYSLGYVSDYYDVVCESNPAESWSRRGVEARSVEPFGPGLVLNNAIIEPLAMNTSGPLRIHAGGGDVRYWYQSDEKTGVLCNTAQLRHYTCPGGGAWAADLRDAFLEISPYAWLAYSQNNVLNGYAPVGAWWSMRYPGTRAAHGGDFAGLQNPVSFGDLTFSVELIP